MLAFQPPRIFFDAEEETPEVAVTHYLESIQILTTHLPQSEALAQCRTNLGYLLILMKKFTEAEEQLLRACKLFQTLFPLSINFAICLNNMGFLYTDTGDYKAAEDYYIKAVSFFSEHFPQSAPFAGCLDNLGTLYMLEGRVTEAAPLLQQALYLRAK